jgi:hypothetical protein
MKESFCVCVHTMQLTVGSVMLCYLQRHANKIKIEAPVGISK